MTAVVLNVISIGSVLLVLAVFGFLAWGIVHATIREAVLTALRQWDKERER